MKNIIDILRESGVDVPADKVDALSRSVAENYKTVAEYTKKVEKLESERDAQKARADGAEETLKGFDGIDPAKIKDELAEYQRRAESAEKDYAAKLEQRDFRDTLENELAEIKFTSAAAAKAVRDEIERAGLKRKDGKILGLSDLISRLRTSDPDAFAPDDNTPPPARFTQPSGGANGNGNPITKKQIMDIKDTAERYAKIRENLHLYRKES